MVQRERDAEIFSEIFSDTDAVKENKETITKKIKIPIKCGGKEVRALIPSSNKMNKIDESSTLMYVQHHTASIGVRKLDL